MITSAAAAEAAMALMCCTCTWPEYILFVMTANPPGGMTIEATLYSWRLDRFDSGSAMIVRSRDGAMSLRYSKQTSRLFGLFRRSYEVSERPRDPPIARPNSDPECRDAGIANGIGPPKHETLLGRRVLVYEFASGLESRSMAMAPDLGCLVMRSTFRQKSRFGIPVEIGWWEVTSIRP